MELSDYRNTSGFDETSSQADEVDLLNFADELDRLDIQLRYKNDFKIKNSFDK